MGLSFQKINRIEMRNLIKNHLFPLLEQNQLDALIRFGYAMMIITILLMIWTSLAGARELENHKYPPCLFSPLCTCSKASPNDLGIIQCRNVPYPSIPRTVNNSKVCHFQYL